MDTLIKELGWEHSDQNGRSTDSVGSKYWDFALCSRSKDFHRVHTLEEPRSRTWSTALDDHLPRRPSLSGDLRRYGMTDSTHFEPVFLFAVDDVEFSQKPALIELNRGLWTDFPYSPPIGIPSPVEVGLPVAQRGELSSLAPSQTFDSNGWGD